MGGKTRFLEGAKIVAGKEQCQGVGGEGGNLLGGHGHECVEQWLGKADED